MRRRGLSAAVWLALLSQAQAQTQPPPASAADAPSAGTVEITAPRPRVITPLPGVVLERERSSTQVQSATAADIRRAQAVTLTDFMLGAFQSVSVNDYQGNPFQQDLVFRGFSASPLIGTPQGLAVVLDGVRVNEPFGEVVNWDLIPLLAIERMDLLPGANPLFGLNALGGALALATKSGFSAPGVEASALAGSFGRRQVQLAAGANDGTTAGFVALNRYDEDGWRDDSPSRVRQAFARVDVRLPWGSLVVNGLSARNRLVGNGLAPSDQVALRPESVFTSPDRTENRADHVRVLATLDLGDAASLALQLYRRRVSQDSIGGDLWDEFRTAASRLLPDCPDGISVADGAIGVDLPGCPGLLPNGVYNFGRTAQRATGASLQFSWSNASHQLVAGLALDRNSVQFGQGQRLGYIADDRSVVLAPERYEDLGLTALATEIQRNNLVGGSRAASLYLQDTWTVQSGLHLSAGARLVRTRVTSQLQSDRPIPLYQFDANLARRLQNRCGAENGDIFARLYCTSGDYRYESLNPQLGVSWQAQPSLTLHANWGRGARVPSTIELGCARDRVAEQIVGGGVRNTGRTPGCSVPTALSYDPYLPQVRAESAEIGLRGVAAGWLWNATLWHTTLRDDILFVSLGSRNRGVFDTFGRTQRQGFDLGVEGRLGRHALQASWSRVDASFESAAEVVNLSNSSSSKVVGQVNIFRIAPGDRIPGIPRDTLRLAWSWQPASGWRLGLNLRAHAGAFVRGNENNAHQPGGTDSNGIPTLGTLDPSITVEPGRRYVGAGRTPGFAVVNLQAEAPLARGFSLKLRVDNLFDRRYVTAGELGLNPFVASRWGARDASGFNFNSNDWTHALMVGPGMPRALQVSLHWELER